MSPQHQQQQQQQKPSATKRRSTTTLYGKSTKLSNITAASKLTQKSVYCIDNVNIGCSVKELCDFVSALSVKVISCFETKPRRRRNVTDDDDGDEHDGVIRPKRKAFRLCIDKDDTAKLLNPAAWPHSVIISEWFFKSPGNKTAQNTGARAIDVGDHPATSGGGSSNNNRGATGGGAAVRDGVDGGDVRLLCSGGDVGSSHPAVAAVAADDGDDRTSTSIDDDGTILMAEHNPHDGGQC